MTRPVADPVLAPTVDREAEEMRDSMDADNDALGDWIGVCSRCGPAKRRYEERARERAFALSAEVSRQAAEVERLAQVIAAMDDDADQALTDRAEAVEGEAQAADRIISRQAAVIAQVRGLHVADHYEHIEGGTTYSFDDCAECGHGWPCSTLAALDGSTSGSADT